MQHHYVIMFDDVTNEWIHDTETEEDVFSDGTAYDSKAKEWISPHIGDGVFIDNEEELCAKVSVMINQLNEETK
jgi:hypothetical protein